MTTVLDRFLSYVSYNTQSDPKNDACPSTPGQRVLAEKLAEELRAIGVQDAAVDADGYVYGSVPATGKGPAIGLIAHMDTSPDSPGDVKPRIVESYDGSVIRLNGKITLDPAEFPALLAHKGERLVVTDGSSLLGADDKAGAAEIVTAVDRILRSGKPHGRICIGFTPDEEIGRGADRFDIARFGADFAYTLDGGELGGIEYENFNAASAVVSITGKSIHPGAAKGRMVNACLVAMEFRALLPEHEQPVCTEGYEGFWHLCEMRGDVESAELEFIIRDHDMGLFEKRKDAFRRAAAFLQAKYGEDAVRLDIKDSYYNMKEKLAGHMDVVERAERAMRAAGMTPVATPIRGGTDGARLSWMGLPCPNLCTGGQNYHGRQEWVSVDAMEKCVDMICALFDER